MMSAHSVETLPRIVRFIGVDDCPDSACPHCGASGRFILHFKVEDGRELAAMRGCASLFPVSRVATEELRLQQKLARYRKNGWSRLNRLDSDALEAIAAFYTGTLDEHAALERVDLAKRANQRKFR